MKNLSDFKEDINRCSKCGLCQSVCPVFKETGNECAVSKGKFVMLDGVLKGDLKLNKNINKYLDMCLKCGKCTDFCPSGIDICKIFEAAKYEYARKTLFGKIIFFLESKYVFGNIIKILKLLSYQKYKKILKQVQNDTMNEPTTTLKLLYFKGCVGNIFPHTMEILKQIPNIKIIEKDFDCCGIPFLSSGNLERYEEVKAHNLKLIDECEFDYILTDCASCESTLKGYFENETQKFINIGELIAKQNIKFKSEKPVKVTFHKPCHLKNTDFVKQLFKNCENIEYVEMKNFDDCCGFAGEFAIKNHKLSKQISHKKAENIIQTGADYVVTTCPSCILGIKQGLFGMDNAPKELSLSEFLSKLQIVN